MNTNSHQQRSGLFLINVVAVMVLVALLASVALLSLSPWYILGLYEPPILRLGVFDSSGLLPSIEAAVEDINQSVRGLNPRPPFVRLYIASTEATVTDEFKRLHNQDEVRVFIVASKKSLNEIKTFVRTNQQNDPKLYAEAVIVR